MRSRYRRALSLMGVVPGLLLAQPAEPSQPARHLRLDVLAVVYTRTFTHTADAGELRDLRAGLDEVVESFWKGSRRRLRLSVDTLHIDRLVSEDQFSRYDPEHYWFSYSSPNEVNSVENDLVGRGFALNSYDVIAVFYAWENGPGHRSRYGGAAFPVHSVLGKAAYLAIPLVWSSDQLRSIFEHEMLHVVASIFEHSGYSDFPVIHNQDFFRLVYGEDVSWLRWILGNIPEESYLELDGTWGTVEASEDGDS